jgi:hypothetical protein
MDLNDIPDKGKYQSLKSIMRFHLGAIIPTVNMLRSLTNQNNIKNKKFHHFYSGEHLVKQLKLHLRGYNNAVRMAKVGGTKANGRKILIELKCPEIFEDGFPLNAALVTAYHDAEAALTAVNAMSVKG